MSQRLSVWRRFLGFRHVSLSAWNSSVTAPDQCYTYSKASGSLSRLRTMTPLRTRPSPGTRISPPQRRVFLGEPFLPGTRRPPGTCPTCCQRDTRTSQSRPTGSSGKPRPVPENRDCRCWPGNSAKEQAAVTTLSGRRPADMVGERGLVAGGWPRPRTGAGRAGRCVGGRRARPYLTAGVRPGTGPRPPPDPINVREACSKGESRGVTYLPVPGTRRRRRAEDTRGGRLSAELSRHLHLPSGAWGLQEQTPPFGMWHFQNDRNQRLRHRVPSTFSVPSFGSAPDLNVTFLFFILFGGSLP